MRFGLLLGLLFFPAVAGAVNFFGPIVPPCTESGLGAGFCQWCNLAQLASRLLRAFVVLAAMGAAVMFAYAGFLYVSASTSSGNIQSAKSVFSNVFIGLILVIAAWLIVDIALRTFMGQSLNVLTNFKCVEVKLVDGQFTFPTVPQNDDDVPAQATDTTAGEGEGLDNVDSNTNYNPIACQNINNYSKNTDPNWRDRNGLPASCTDAKRAASAAVENECMQGCIGAANGNRIITVADYKFCTQPGNTNASLPPINQTTGWQDFGAMSCSQVRSRGVTVATPQGSGITRGQRFTWPELARRHGLPEDTVFVADDSYGRDCSKYTGRRCGYTSRGTYSIDVARCVPGISVGCSSIPSYGSTVPMKTRPTPVPGG